MVNDEFPKISVSSDIDSVSRGPVQFIGQLSDDYGIQKLQLVYYDKNLPNTYKTHQIKVPKSAFTDFYYVFPEQIEIEQGIDYELYFEVFDNDVVNGSKKTKSAVFSFYNKTNDEIKEELLQEQKNNMNAISKTVEELQKTNETLDDFKNELQNKPQLDWNDTKKLQEFLKRQQQYQEMFKKQTNALEENLNEQPENENLKEKKDALKERFEETKKLAEQEKLFEELKELSEKLQKEDLVEKLKKLAKQNKQNELSLERILELTKQFYVEQKANQIAQKLEELAKKQEAISNEGEKNSIEKQNEVQEKFNEVKEDFNQLNNQNKALKKPKNFPDFDADTKDIQQELNKASEAIKENSPKAKENQKAASKKMDQLSKKMQQTMSAMSGESIDENIEDLRKIVENLIEFSFLQEDLMNTFSNSDYQNPEYPKNIKQQHTLKEYFEHIDDSLYVLSLRVVQMSSMIQNEVGEVHYNIDEAITHFTDNKFNQGISNQQFVITSANNLANSLSDLLESLMNASPSFGSGSGQNQISLPDIIQKQGELIEKMKEGMNKGSKEGENSEENNEALYEVYKEQTALKQLLKDILGEQLNNTKSGDNVDKLMEELENELLEKGFTSEVIEKMKQLNYELLKLEKAVKEQGQDTERKSDENKNDFELRSIKKLQLQNQYFNYNEILNRQSLPLRTVYQKKVQEYFKTQ